MRHQNYYYMINYNYQWLVYLRLLTLVQGMVFMFAKGKLEESNWLYFQGGLMILGF